MTKAKRREMVEQFASLAREYHRTGNVTLRAQAEESIRELLPRAMAAKVIRDLYTAR